MEIEDGILVHRIQEPRRPLFSERIAPVFAARHAEHKFDVLEGPDYGADARGAVELVPDIPLVVKLHAPSYLAAAINLSNPTLLGRARRSLATLRRTLRPRRRPNTDRERIHAMAADEIMAPSRAIRDRVAKDWELDAARVSHVPLAYIPSAELLRIPIETVTNVVTFVGRLEMGKGVLDLAKAIPSIVRRHPGVKIRFVGRPSDSPDPRLDMRQYLEQILADYHASVEFPGPVPLDGVPQILASTDVSVIPSIWENFPCVCLEAMAAGRGIAGSNSGGMVEMLNNGEVGRLSPPRDPKRLAAAVNGLLDAPTVRMELGRTARERVIREYNAERIAHLQEASYVRAIERRRKLGPREQDQYTGERRRVELAPAPAGQMKPETT